jgi:hypothetical protein
VLLKVCSCHIFLTMFPRRQLLLFIFNFIVYVIFFKIRSGSARSIGYHSFPGTEYSFVIVEPRMRLSNSKLEVWRCESDSFKCIRWNHNDLDHCLDLSTNIDCYIYGIIVFGSTQYSGQHDVNIKILNGLLEKYRSTFHQKTGIFPSFLPM